VVSEEEIRLVLDHLTEPLSGLSLCQAGLVKGIFIENSKIKIVFQYPSPHYPYKEEVKRRAEEEIRELGLFSEIIIEEAEREVRL
jgi:hypothetical protein